MSTLANTPYRAATMVGVPASPGVAIGPARVVFTSDYSEVLPGEILVVPSLHASWILQIERLSAVVTVAGSTRSDAAILACENGIPMVCDVPGATTFIATGQTITVNGTNGTVELGE